MLQSRFDEEYARVADFLELLAMRLTQDSALANDLAQDTIYRALSNCEHFEEGTNFKAWMSTIMRNTFISGYRKRVRTPHHVSTAVFAAGNQQAMSRNDGPGNLTIKEMLVELSNLDEVYARPFTLHYSGYRYEEIAQLMQLPIGTVKSRIFAARRQLKDKLRLQR